MQRFFSSLLLFSGVVFFLASCGDLMEVRTIHPKEEKSKKFTQDSQPTLGGNPNAKYSKPNEDVAASNLAPEEVGFLPTEVGEGVVAGGMLLPSDKDLVWTSGKINDNDFETAFKGPPKKKGNWMFSYEEARRESMRTGKPILMWFTKTGDSPSPLCRRLNQKLFATHKFSACAKENVIRLKIDVAGGEVADKDKFGNIAATTTQKRKYAEKLKKQYHVLGFPTLVVLEPSGSVYSRERGFKSGSEKELWGKLKNAALTIEHNRGVWERKMAKKGYRRWTGTNEVTLFAKLTRFHDGVVLLTEPDGNVIRTTVAQLSSEDYAWIVAEKEKRGR